MRVRCFVLILCHTAFMGVVGALPATLERLDADAYPAARCLDGSPGAYYFRSATAGNEDKWVFFLEGGGECVTKDSCLGRAKTDLGSSTRYKNETGLSYFQVDDGSWNPFAGYNQVFIKYCSGDLFLGTYNGPSSTAWGLQFSGRKIVEAVLATLKQEKNLDRASFILWSGVSAGGIGSVAQLDDVAAAFPAAKVVGAPIAGFYFSNNWTYTAPAPAPVPYIPWSYASFETYYGLWRAHVPQACAAERPDTPWQCIVAHGSFATLKTPVVFIEAQTDAVVTSLHCGLPPVWRGPAPQCNGTVHGCPAPVAAFLDLWGGRMRDAMAEVTASPVSGHFFPACLTHGGFSHTSPTIEGQSYLSAVAAWVFEGKVPKLKDTCGILCNPTCQRPG